MDGRTGAGAPRLPVLVDARRDEVDPPRRPDPVEDVEECRSHDVDRHLPPRGRVVGADRDDDAVLVAHPHARGLLEELARTGAAERGVDHLAGADAVQVSAHAGQVAVAEQHGAHGHEPRVPWTWPMTTEQDVLDTARRAREASHGLALATRAQKDAALLAMAEALLARWSEVLDANADDVGRAEADGTPANIVDRLRLTPQRLEDMARGLREVAALPDPVGEVVRGSTLANGLELRQVRVPFGVVGMIYEARPNVTADAAGICLKSGNAVLLRGSSSAPRRATPRSWRCCATPRSRPGSTPTSSSWCPATPTTRSRR